MSPSHSMSSNRKQVRARPRSLPINEWPHADQKGWGEACRPGVGLRRGGRANHYAEVSRDDFARRYGAYSWAFLQRSGLLDLNALPPRRMLRQVSNFTVAELKGRVRSVTVWNCVYKLRMAAKLVDPQADFSLAQGKEDRGKDLALVMVPQSKFDRLVLAHRLVEAGLTTRGRSGLLFEERLWRRAKGIRNGLLDRSPGGVSDPREELCSPRNRSHVQRR